MKADLDAGSARRIAIEAQGFGKVGRAPHEILDDQGVIQLDPLTRVEKAHRLSVLARSPRDVLSRTVDAGLWSCPGAVAFETYTHAACLVPVQDWPLFRLKRAAASQRVDSPSTASMDQVLSLIAESPDGLTLKQIEGSRPRTSGWNWSEHKRAAEHLVWRGELAVTRRPTGSRVFDIASRTIPAAHLNRDMDSGEILTALASKAVRALGIATVRDVASHYHLSVGDAQMGLDLCGHERLTVEGWAEPAWVSDSILREPRQPRPTQPRLVGPFDNLIRDRNRTRRIFGFDYIFEAYKPAAKRRYGHYVLVLAENEALTGRVDARTDQGTLVFDMKYPEPDVSPAAFDKALNGAAEILAGQLGVTLR